MGTPQSAYLRDQVSVRPKCPRCGSGHLWAHGRQGELYKWSCRGCHKGFRTTHQGSIVTLPPSARASYRLFNNPDTSGSNGAKRPPRYGVITGGSRRCSHKNWWLPTEPEGPDGDKWYVQMCKDCGAETKMPVHIKNSDGLSLGSLARSDDLQVLG